MENDTIDFTYKITIDSNKLKKVLTLNLGARAHLVKNDSRMWNMKSTWKKAGKPYENSRISYIDSYLYSFRDILTASNRGIHTDIDIARLTREQKLMDYLNILEENTFQVLEAKFFY